MLGLEFELPVDELAAGMLLLHLLSPALGEPVDANSSYGE